MKTLTVRVRKTPVELAWECLLEAEDGEAFHCPFLGAECPLGIVSCGDVTPKMWEELLEDADAEVQQD